MPDLAALVASPPPVTVLHEQYEWTVTVAADGPLAEHPGNRHQAEVEITVRDGEILGVEVMYADEDCNDAGVCRRKCRRDTRPACPERGVARGAPPVRTADEETPPVTTLAEARRWLPPVSQGRLLNKTSLSPGDLTQVRGPLVTSTGTASPATRIARGRQL